MNTVNSARIGSLCTGFGGLDMGAAAAVGGRTVWTADPEPGPSAILAHRYPQAPNLGDITAINWDTVPAIDVLCAGFPCQDISNAGRRAGIKEGTRSGIWTNVAAAIGALRPDLVILENVAAITVRRPGLDVVLADLAEIGLDARWTHLRASDIGAPHRRDRWFAIAWPADAHPDHLGRPGTGAAGRAEVGHAARPGAAFAHAEGVGQREPANQAVAVAAGGNARPQPGRRSLLAAANTESHGRQQGRPEPARLARGSGAAQCRNTDWGAYTAAVTRWEHITGRTAPEPTEDAPRSGRRLAARFVEWLMGLEPGWVTDVPGLTRTAQLTALGNGVVPQQAFTAISWLTAASTKETVS
ncbi:MAG: DNA cytosine methyltransferase [Stackebrandtia sp.]